jgi:formyltetrahydrofolate hydrolase
MFSRSEELDKNFLDLTNQQAIDYINLGNYMAVVMDEFNKALEFKMQYKL